jgi:DedD protein
MPLPSFMQRKKAPAAADSGLPEEVGPVHDARVRARRRLIGAVVLLAVGLVVFPTLFESKPRPMPVDIPIEVVRKEVIAPPKPVAVVPRAVTPAPPPDAGTETPAAPVVATAASEPAAPPPVAAVAKPTPAVVAMPAPAAASATKGRFVVQVGAFNEATALREARAKVEKLGLKTYTQVVETPTGARTRVRVGPFDTRDEADRASARLKASGLPAYILAL